MFKRLSSPPLPAYTISLAPRSSGLTTALVLLALGSVLAASWRLCASTHQRRLSSRHRAKPKSLQTWESEGGQHREAAEPALQRAL